MRVVLIIVTLADLGLGALLIAVSGFILEGVNNTGPMVPESVLFVLMIALCFVAPLIAWVLRGRSGPAAALGIAVVPLVIGLFSLLISPP